jgi:hypothetical protein
MLRKRLSNKRIKISRKSSRKLSKRKSIRHTKTKKSSRRKSSRRKKSSKLLRTTRPRIITRTRRTRSKRSTMKMLKKENGRRFIHFGCWNKGGCNKEEIEEKQTNLTKVMVKLNEVVNSTNSNEDDVDFLIISGDNYYPDKKKIKGTDKKVKTIDLINLQSGFECLPKNLKKYILLGNHELEKIKLDESGPECQVLSLQRKYKSENNIIFEDPSSSSDVIMHTTMGDDNALTVIIMLDTTMYDNDYNTSDSKENLEKLLVCYKELYNIPLEDNSTIQDIQQNQQQRVSKLIDELVNNKEIKIKNIIVVGHHPIISGKSKYKDDGKIKTKFDCMNLLLDVYYKNIYQPLQERNINFYYFCADLHLYQTGLIKYQDLVINQYISGTGGAELDQYVHKDDTPKQCSNYTDEYPQYIITESKRTCGFMDCCLKNDGNLEITFHEVEPNE